MHACLRLLLSVPFALVVGHAAAQSPQQPPAQSSSTKPSRAAISRIVESLARDLDRVPSRVLVAAAPLVSDAAAPRAAQLTATLTSQLAGRLGSGARARSEPASLQLAREAAFNESALVYLSVEIAAGYLRVAADVYPVPRTIWARIRDPEPGPIAHAFAQALIDPEVRTFLTPIPLVTVSIDRAKNFESDVVALACGDLDLDGNLEILSVSRRRITTVRLRAGKVVPLVSRSWPDLVAVHPTPLREPIAFATLVVREQEGERLPSFVDVALTDRARSLRFDGKLQIVAELPGVAIPDAASTACTKLWGLVVTGPVLPCAAGDPIPVSTSVGGRYDAIASSQLLNLQGEPYAVWLGREDGTLELRDDSGRRGSVSSAGAQLAVGDLDQDGEPEILASLDVLNPLEDAVVVRSWAHRGGASRDKPREVLRLPVPAGVRALAVCPPDGPGHTPFVVATADEIWVVR